jgi:site-specific DNA-cytosine methylase
MVIVSTFDGMSCIQIALKVLGIEEYTIYCSEIDEHAIKVTKSNFPNTIHVGNICNIQYNNGVLYTEKGNFNVPNVDLYVGGSPCQSLSGLGDGTGLDGKSGLMFEWLRLRDDILSECSTLVWLLENVKPKKKIWLDDINNLVGEKGILFNANEMLPISRPRYFWSNKEFSVGNYVKTPLDQILTTELEDETNILSDGRKKWILGESGVKCCKRGFARVINQSSPTRDLQCLTARSEGSWNSNYILRKDGNITKLSVNEYEALQGVPLNYTESVKTAERYKMLGNGWCVHVIVEILKQILK